MEFLELALDLCISGGYYTTRYEVLDSIAWIKWKLGDYHMAQIYACQAKELAAAVFGEAMALWVESLACSVLGNYKDGVQMCRRARNLLNLCGQFQGHTHHMLLNTEAELHLFKSEYTEARSINVRISREASPEQLPYHYALALQNIASIDVMIGADPDSICQKLQEAHIIYDAMGHPSGLSFSDVIHADP
jgi:tetratricopeptide (TPR) repeat protein